MPSPGGDAGWAQSLVLVLVYVLGYVSTSSQHPVAWNNVYGEHACMVPTCEHTCKRLRSAQGLARPSASIALELQDLSSEGLLTQNLSSCVIADVSLLSKGLCAGRTVVRRGARAGHPQHDTELNVAWDKRCRHACRCTCIVWMCLMNVCTLPPGTC